MIEVKGTRTAQPAQDPTDPLGLRKPLEPSHGAVTGVLAGLLGLAVYLRSFLWAEPARAAGADEDARSANPGNDAGPGPSVSRTRLAVASSQTGEVDRKPAADDGQDGAMPLPDILGPFERAILLPQTPSLVPDALRVLAANTPLPPFIPPRKPLPPDLADLPPSFLFPGPEVREPELQAMAPADPADDEPGPDDPGSGTDGATGGTTGEGVGASGSQGGPASDSAQRNRAPRNNGPVWLGDVGSGATLAFALSHLLAHTTDEDGDPLTVTLEAPVHGTIEPRSAGWRYLADFEHLGEVEIRYSISDGLHQLWQSALLTVVENLREGTGDDDLLTGTEGRDRILGHAGHDNIAGFGGRDLVWGGAGDDNIAGGAGQDTLFGEDGDDLIAGGAGSDLIFGGAGHDRLYGEEGDDEIHGDEGDDLLDGGAGADTMTGGTGHDTLFGGTEADLLAGGEGDDRIEGGDGDDLAFGDEGDDLLFGDAGADLLFGGAGNDGLDGGEGDDLLSGGEGDDHLLGAAGDDLLEGGAGDDSLCGGAGADTVLGGAGDDIVTLDRDDSVDRLEGGEGIDGLIAAEDSRGLRFDLTTGSVSEGDGPADSFAGFEVFVGSREADLFLASDGNATLTGNGGGDVFAFVPGDRVEQARFRITDFTEADLLQFSGASGGFSMRKAQRALEDQVDDFFEDYSERFDADEPKLRYYHDWTEDYQRTIVEVDFDHDRSIDLVLTLDGGHVFDMSSQMT